MNKLIYSPINDGNKELVLLKQEKNIDKLSFLKIKT